MNRATKKRCVVISALGEESFSPEQVRRIHAVTEASFHARLYPLESSEFITLCRDADLIAITRRTIKDLNQHIIDALPSLNGLSIYATGYEWIDVDYLAQRGIPVSHLPHYCTVSVAEHTLAMILTMSRRIHVSSDKARGLVAAGTSLRGWEARGKRVGIIGFGRIGSEVAKLAAAIGMEVCFHDKRAINTEVQSVPFAELLKNSDVVVLAASRERNAPAIIGSAEIALMKEGAYLINPARADLVDNAVLLNAIRKRKLAGYAVDDTLPILAGDDIEPGRVLQTAHSAWYSTEALQRGTESWVQNIIALAEGRPINLVGASA